MSTKKELKLLTELLEIEGIKVYSHRQYEGIGIILQIEQSKKESICIRCGSRSSKLHQNHRQIIKDLPWGEKSVFLEINRRQFKCEKCHRPFSEEMEFVKARRTCTKRLAEKVLAEVLENDISSVARKGVVTTEEIERILKDAAENLLETQPVGLKRLGIDEIALVKGQGKYCAVLVDIERAKLLMILESRTKEEIKKVLLGWGVEVLEGIEEVSIDLWRGYKSLVKEIMPKAQVIAEAQKYFVNSHSTIIRWLDEILAYFDNRTTSGVVEGINNKLKLIKRKAYGFTNFENFRTRCLLNWRSNY